MRELSCCYREARRYGGYEDDMAAPRFRVDGVELISYILEDGLTIQKFDIDAGCGQNPGRPDAPEPGSDKV